MKEDISQLEQIVPIPIEEDPSDEYSDSTFNLKIINTTSHSTNSITKSHDIPSSSFPNHNLRKQLLSILYRTQKYSAYTLVGFLGIHLTSVVIVPIIPIDKDIKHEIFEMARNVYHGIPFYEELFILAAAVIHVVSGISSRIVRRSLYNKTHVTKKNSQHNHHHHDDVLKIVDDTRDDIGLGGLTNFLGLGYKKSWVSKTLGIAPLNFTGYLLIPSLLYHVYKFRWVPLVVDGDSNLINLEYISYYLNMDKLIPYLNGVMLGFVLYVGSYHFVNGLFKYFRKFSPNWKRIGFAIVNGFSIIGFTVIIKFRGGFSLSNDFIGKSFVKYLSWGYI
ncbi:uncharacterized protein RJT21DRAFT_14670 [Scheffersomyces amazonensis]|uniref:uncharacterized protein n=1 Tax=Scheffersomyces amazonensis TaxID=1078765 RepID=UPI00315D9100